MSLRLKRKRDHETAITVDKLNKLKKYFTSNKVNNLIQNSLCTTFLHNVAENREYMQSRDKEFSNTLDPELQISNQGLSGRCWLFAVLNVMRHELVRKFDLPHNFELSESYVCFYEKMEKCNFFLTEVMKLDSLDTENSRVRDLLHHGCSDGGLWITCANIIKKYGIIPKSCYRESINSFITETMNDTLNGKLREFALELTSTPQESRSELKNKMMSQIYEVLCKMLGTPPNPNEKFTWSFSEHLDLTKLLEREMKRQKTSGQYENLQLKNTFDITPLEFYKYFIVNKVDDYICLAHDPRNEYNKCYQSYNRDVVVEGNRHYYYNVSIKDMSEACILSILDNTPIEFDCDVCKYINVDESLLDNKCYDFSLVFGENFDKLTKEQALRCLNSYPTHAMVLVGVDLDEDGNPLKWKVENSWGRSHDSNGYWTMSHEWFERFVFGAVVQKQYLPTRLLDIYKLSSCDPITLPKNDILGQ